MTKRIRVEDNKSIQEVIKGKEEDDKSIKKLNKINGKKVMNKIKEKRKNNRK